MGCALCYAVQCNAMQCNAVWCDDACAMQCSVVWSDDNACARAGKEAWTAWRQRELGCTVSKAVHTNVTRP